MNLQFILNTYSIWVYFLVRNLLKLFWRIWCTSVFLTRKVKRLIFAFLTGKADQQRILPQFEQNSDQKSSWSDWITYIYLFLWIRHFVKPWNKNWSCVPNIPVKLHQLLMIFAVFCNGLSIFWCIAHHWSQVSTSFAGFDHFDFWISSGKSLGIVCGKHSTIWKKINHFSPKAFGTSILIIRFLKWLKFC